MTSKLSDSEAEELWRMAEHRLRLIDREPPVALSQVDALLQTLGPRRREESLTDWLQRSRALAAEAAPRPSAEIIPFSPKFSPKRQRFTPVAEIVRLAADSGGREIALPSRELETADGRFRLKVTSEGDQVVIEIQALGLAADEFAGKTHRSRAGGRRRGAGRAPGARRRRRRPRPPAGRSGVAPRFAQAGDRPDRGRLRRPDDERQRDPSCRAGGPFTSRSCSRAAVASPVTAARTG